VVRFGFEQSRRMKLRGEIVRGMWWVAVAALMAGGCSSGGSSQVAPSTNATGASASANPTDPTTTSTVVSTSTTSTTSTTTSTTTTTPPVALVAGEPWIVYEGPAVEGAGVILIRPDGSAKHWDTPNVPVPKGGWQVHPDWSPDGSQLTFAVDDGTDNANATPPTYRTRDIWIADADGEHARRVFDCSYPCIEADDPSWSHDGRTIAFDAFDDDVQHPGQAVNIRVVLLDVATGSLTTVATGADTDQFLWPRWSPDGKRLVVEVDHFTTPDANGTLSGSAIAVVDLTRPGTKLKVLTDFAMWATYPDWHPKENVIVFSTRPWDDLKAGPSNLYTIRPDGTAMRQLTHYTEGQTRAVQPSWTPDGTRIIFTAVEGTGFGKPTMAIIGRDGKGLQSATASGPMFGTHPRLRPGT
jgi:Tol biopolymer transport system component